MESGYIIILFRFQTFSWAFVMLVDLSPRQYACNAWTDKTVPHLRRERNGSAWVTLWAFLYFRARHLASYRRVSPRPSDILRTSDVFTSESASLNLYARNEIPDIAAKARCWRRRRRGRRSIDRSSRGRNLRHISPVSSHTALCFYGNVSMPLCGRLRKRIPTRNIRNRGIEDSRELFLLAVGIYRDWIPYNEIIDFL